MKSGWKIFWIITGCIAGLGVAFCALALILGVRVRDVQEGNPFRFGIVSGIVDFFDGDDEGDTPDTAYEFDGDYDYSFENVRNFSLEAGGCEIEIYQHSGDTVNIDTSGLDLPDFMKFSAEENNGNLTVSLKRESGHVESQTESLGTLYRELPVDAHFQNTEITVGAADFYLQGISTDSLNLEAGALDCQIDWFAAKPVEATVGAGDLDMEGSLAQNMNLECGVGDANVLLQGSETDYNYTVDCGLGSVDIGDSIGFSGVASSRSIDNGSSRQIGIVCGVGDVTLSFE